MNNIEGINYERILKLLTDKNFILKNSKSDYKDRTLWNRISELTILIEKYLAMKECLEDKGETKILLLKQFRKRNLNDLFVSSLKKNIDCFENILLEPFTPFLKHLLNDEAAFFNAHQNNMDEYKRYTELYEINLLSYVILCLIINNFDALVNERKGVKINSELSKLVINSAEIKKIINLIAGKDKKIGNQLLMLHGLTLTFKKKWE